MNIYKYEVKYYLEECAVTARGAVCADTLSNAVDALANYYGEGDIIKLTIGWHDYGVVIEEEEEKEEEET